MTFASRRTLVARLGVLAFAACAFAASAADIKVATSGGSAAALKALLPAYEKASGDKVELIFGPSMGDTPNTIPTRLGRGEPIDVVVMVDGALDKLIASGKVDPASKTTMARSFIAVAVKAGSPHPDISTPEAVRGMLLAAKSVAWSDSASGVYIQTTLIPKLGITDALRGKGRMIPADPVGEVVARGDAEIGFQQLSELKPVKGIDIVGLLPDSLQLVTPYSAGKVAASTHPEAASAFIRFLASPAAAGTIRQTGLEPGDTGH